MIPLVFFGGLAHGLWLASLALPGLKRKWIAEHEAETWISVRVPGKPGPPMTVMASTLGDLRALNELHGLGPVLDINLGQPWRE